MTSVRRIADITKREGAPGLLSRTLAEFFYRHLVLYELTSETAVPRLPMPSGFEIERLQSSDLDRYLAVHAADTREELERRLAQGDECFCARTGEEIVSVLWVTRRPHLMRYVGYELKLEPDEVYLYDAFTVRAWRSHRILSVLTQTVVFAHFEKAGRRAVLAIRPENRASARVVRNLGGRPYAKVGYIGPRGFRRAFFKQIPN